jgi:hypothetical protein
VIVQDIRLVLADIPAGLDDPPAMLRKLFDKASSDPLRTANDQAILAELFFCISIFLSIKPPDWPNAGFCGEGPRPLSRGLRPAP